MKSIVGVFLARADAIAAIDKLRAVGIKDDAITLVGPGTHTDKDDIPLSETEQSGMGKTVGGVVGGALGAQLGTVAATSLLVPGVGTIVGAGLAATAVLAGIFGGAVVGGKLEDALAQGIPIDELYVYEDAIRQGRTILFVTAADAEQADKARRLIEKAGSESLDLARDRWWIGLRSAEKESYDVPGSAFDADEPAFRRGFEAALERGSRGKTFPEMRATLAAREPEDVANPAYAHGYERGRAYLAQRSRR